MNRMVLFGIVVFVGVLGLVILSNQGNTKQLQALNLPISPTPQASPIPTQTTSTPSADASPTTVTQTPPEAVTATKAVLSTSKGNITLELYPQDAPKTVVNFVKKAKSGFYKDLTFHRVEDWVVQGGDPLGNGRGGGSMDTELNSKPFVTGSLGVARGGDIKVSNDSQFFITKKDASWLDGQYTNFGIVTEGMDVVNKMEIGDKILGITVE